MALVAWNRRVPCPSCANLAATLNEVSARAEAAEEARETEYVTLTAEVELLRRVVTLTNADDPYCVDCQEGSCGAYREWRERFGQEAGR